MFEEGVKIIARLQAQASTLKTVEWSSEVTALDDVGPLCPAAFVQPAVRRPDSRVPYEASASTHQEFLVIVCVQRGDLPLEGVARPFMDEVRRALNGWRIPGAGHIRPVRWLADEQPEYPLPGYGEFPLRFAYPVIVGGAAS